MMIFSGNKLNLSGWRGGAIYVFAAAFALNGVLMGSRHDAFSICSILWVGWCLARRRWPTIARAVPALFIACSAALLMVGYRNVLHLGEHKPNTPSFAEAATTGVASEFADLRMRTSGVEFVAHAVTLETVDETQKYHWGLNWLYEYTVQVVPRIWWPEKPYRFETPGITQDDVSSVTGVRLASGYAPGLVADLYSQFGLLSLFFFMWLGWCAKRLVLRAVYGNRPIDVCAYIMAFSLSLNVFGQGFGAILVAFPYSMVPVLLYHWAEGSQRHMAGGLIAGCRFRPAAMRPIF
jgi:hypothetical protein